MKTIVKNYHQEVDESASYRQPLGYSLAPKELLLALYPNPSVSVSILDIGFGEGRLGRFIKSRQNTAHWEIDGIDGWIDNCHNQDLIHSRVYRNIWHGLASEIPAHEYQKYDVICLLDVIEHLDINNAKALMHTLLTGLRDDAHLFVSTPLWFMPQNQINPGDLEEHLIGIPASSMMALLPHFYAVRSQLVGGFIYSKRSLDFINFFQPTDDRNFSMQKGLKIAKAVRMGLNTKHIYKTEI